MNLIADLDKKYCQWFRCSCCSSTDLVLYGKEEDIALCDWPQPHLENHKWRSIASTERGSWPLLSSMRCTLICLVHMLSWLQCSDGLVPESVKLSLCAGSTSHPARSSWSLRRSREEPRQDQSHFIHCLPKSLMLGSLLPIQITTQSNGCFPVVMLESIWREGVSTINCDGVSKNLAWRERQRTRSEDHSWPVAVGTVCRCGISNQSQDIPIFRY